MKICSIEGCGQPYRARGYCAHHYQTIARKQRVESEYDPDDLWAFVKKELNLD